MALEDYLLTEASFTGNEIEGLDDEPTLTAEELKDKFDAAAKNVIMPAVNGVINTLGAITDGASGADNVGATPIAGGTANTTQGILEELKALDLLKQTITDAKTGWFPITGAVTYVSVDNPTGIVTIAGDVAAELKAGRRLKFTNGGNVIYAIVSKDSTYSAPNTTVTFLHEINPTTNVALNLMANSAITLPYFSTQKAPQGFPMQIDKWTMIFRDTVTRTQATPVLATVYNVGTSLLAVPIGSWEVDYEAVLYLANGAPKTGVDVIIGLSTTNNTLVDRDFIDYKYGLSISYAGIMYYASRGKSVNLAAKTTYHLNTRVNAVAPDNINYYGAEATTIIRAVSTLL
jgi:hypothetical protein